MNSLTASLESTIVRAVPLGPRLVLTHTRLVAIVGTVVQRVPAGRVGGGDDLRAAHHLAAALRVFHQVARGGHLQELGAPGEQDPHAVSICRTRCSPSAENCQE